MENKKSTVLLTVIAVATLLVAVVGATFAYFSAQRANNVTRNVIVTTETEASTTFSVGGDLELHVTQAMMAEDATSNPVASAIATVNHRAGSTPTTYCYQLTLDSTRNTFAYSSAASGYDGAGATEPELVLEVLKVDKTGSGSDINLSIVDDEYTTAATLANAASPFNTPATVKNALLTVTDSFTGKTVYDITRFNSASPVVIGKFTITETAGTTYMQGIKVNAYFVNYNWDQSLMSNAGNNASKVFEGNLHLDQVSCS